MRQVSCLPVPRRLAMLCGAAAWALCGAASAQPAPHQNSPERRTVQEKDWGRWLGPFRAKLVPSLMRDFGEQYLYASADAALQPPSPERPRVVFLGDSITDLWPIAESFPARDYVNRGIGSQVSAQLLLRFHADVIALKPRVVVILAGVNDVQGFMQAPDQAGIEANFEAMAELAHAHGIAVVFGSILPVNDYTPEARQVVAERHPDELRAINRWLQAYAAAHGDQYADYYSPMADARGLMRAELTHDGVHPNAKGYAIMTPIAQQAIQRALVGGRS
ncbi:GDSL-type esterase/lipase family protein [Caulobacter sp. S45]|uniref:GDSL-type esterase/lipase family protein n=1 Tax=Caulobacter sp. S45 TaxID=1641861 RepID=UPI0020B14102|nr:GDSL-type esterase/lipase family protein [Caulobacter sp. S45]